MQCISLKYAAAVALLVVVAVGIVNASEDEDLSDEKSFKSKITEALLVNPANKVGHFALDHVDYKSTKYMYDVYEKCLGGCWKYVMDEEDLDKCILSKKESCHTIKGQRAKDLLIYYSTIYAEGKALQATKDKVASVLHLKSNVEDDDDEEDDNETLKEKAVRKGLKIATSAVKSKVTSLAIDAGKEAIQNVLSKSSD